MLTETEYHRLPVFKLNWRDRSRLKRAYDYIRDDGYLTSLPLALEMIDPTIPFFRTSNSTIRKVNEELNGRLLSRITESTDTGYAAKRERSLAWIQKLLDTDSGVVFSHSTDVDRKTIDLLPVFDTTYYERWVLRRVRKNLILSNPNNYTFLCTGVRRFPFTRKLIQKIEKSIPGSNTIGMFMYLNHNTERRKSKFLRIEWINKLLLDHAPFERDIRE